MSNTRIRNSFVTLFLLGGFILAGTFLFLPKPCRAGLSTKNQIPEFFGISRWLNRKTPLTRKSLEGKVAIVSFWNYSCLECLKQMSYLAMWQSKYEDYPFRVVTIHTPRYEFEKAPENVEQAVKKLEILLPVALDPDGVMWRAYNRPAKPVYFIADGRGRIRHISPEKPDYAKEEAVIQDLLREMGKEVMEEIKMDPKKPGADGSPEILFGFRDLSHYGNETRPQADMPLTFIKPAELKSGFYYLSGKWSFEGDAAVALKKGCELAIPFRGSRVFIIAGSLRNNPVPVQVVLDGKALTKQILGRDAKLQKEDGYLQINDDGPYEVVKGLDPAEPHVIELVFEDPDTRVYAAVFD